jgi:hypothetical protein
MALQAVLQSARFFRSLLYLVIPRTLLDTGCGDVVIDLAFYVERQRDYYLSRPGWGN